MKKCSLYIGMAFCAIISLFTVNCDVGLGDAVDVQPPALTIEYPPAGAVVRDAFVLSGTCYDDTGIVQVKVEVFKAARCIASYDADINNDSWSIRLNEGIQNPNVDALNPAMPPLVPEKFYPLADGTYTIDVTAYDGAGRVSGTSSRSFEIDNTAPILLLNKPLAIADETPSSFGRVFKLAGDASDDHNFTLSLYVKQCDQPAKNGAVNFIGDVIEMEGLNVSAMSSDAPLVVAKYYPNPQNEDEEALLENYKKIYGSNFTNGGNPTKYYYAGLRLVDNAKVYQTPGSVTNSTGNETNLYFVNSESLYKYLSNIGTDGVKASDLKKLFNGTDETYAAYKDNIIGELGKAGNYVECASAGHVNDKSSVFTLNPDGNPTWAIAGYALGSDNNSYVPTGSLFRYYANTSSLTLALKPNPDLENIGPRNVALYYEEWKNNSLGKWEVVPNSKQYALQKGGWTESPTNEPVSYTFAISGLEDGRYFKFGIEGTDLMGNEYVTELGAPDGYGFVVSSSDIPPTISVSDPENKTYFKLADLANGGVAIKGTVKETSGKLNVENPLNYRISIVKKGAENVELANNADIKPTVALTYEKAAGSNDTFNWKAKISNASVAAFEQDNYIYSLTFYAKNGKGTESNYAQYVLYGDNVAPSLEISSADLVDHPTILANGAILITEESTSIVGNGANKTYTLRGVWSDVQGAGTKTLMYSTDSNVKGSGTWKEVGVDDTGDAPNVTAKASWNQEFIVQEGEGHSCALYAIDSVGNESEIVSYENVMFDFALPTVAVEENSYDTVSQAAPDKPFVISGTVKDSYMLSDTPVEFKAIRTTGTGSAPTQVNVSTTDQDAIAYGEYVLAADKKSATWRVTIKNDASHRADGVWNIFVIAKDKAERSSVEWISKSISIDNTPPVLEDGTTIEDKPWEEYPENGSHYYQKTTFSLKGKYTEEGSGLAAVYYWVNAAKDDAVTRGDITKASGSFTVTKNTTSGKYEFNAVLAPGVGEPFVSGNNIVTFMAVDLAGNKSLIKGPAWIAVDLVPPEISANATDVLTNGDDEIVFEGAFSDDASGVYKVEISIDDVKISSEAANANGSVVLTEDPSDNKKGTWKATLTQAAFQSLGSGTPRVFGTVYDRAGNTVRSSLCIITIDKTPPTVVIKQPNENAVVNKLITMQGTANDTNGLDRVELEYKTGSGEYQKFNPPVVFTDTAAAWEITDFDTETMFGAIADGTAVTIKATAYDQAGNTAIDERTFKVDQNTDRPIVNILSIEGPGGIVNGSTLKFTLIDDDGEITDPSKVVVRNDTGGGSVAYDSTTRTWTFTPASIQDGDKNVCFTITDKTGVTFSYDNTDAHLRPYVKYMESDELLDLNSTIYFVTDTKPPYVIRGEAMHGKTQPLCDSCTKVPLANSLYVGGTKRKFVNLVFTAADANGIKGMSAIIEDENSKQRAYDSTTNGEFEQGRITYTNDLSQEVEGKSGIWTLPLGELKSIEEDSSDGWIDGEYLVSLNVVDSSGKETPRSFYFRVDFTAPVITSTTPETEVVTNTTFRAKFSDDEGATGSGLRNTDEDIIQYWVVPTLSEQAADSISDESKWKSVGASTTEFSSVLGWPEISKYSNTTAGTGYATQNSDGSVTIPVWFKLRDFLGNQAVRKTKFTVNKTESYATTIFTSPANESKVGSNITITGNASVGGEAQIAHVRLQFDANGDGRYDEADYRILSGNATAADIPVERDRNISNRKWKDWSLTNSLATNQPRLVAGDGQTTWYIAANKTENWQLPIDMSLFNYSYKSEGSPVIKFRANAYAKAKNREGVYVPMMDYDAGGNEIGEHILDWSEVVEYSVVVDTGAPKIENLRVVQYKNGNSGEIMVSRKYISGMYISKHVGNGKWYLTAEISDETALDRYKISGAQGEYLEFNDGDDVEATELSDSAAGDITKIHVGVDSNSKVIPLTNASTPTGEIYLDFTVTDKTGNYATEKVRILVDNDVPVIPEAATTENVTGQINGVNTSAPKLTDGFGQQLGGTFNVGQSDGNFSLQGKISDTGNSGLKYIAFWFEREPKDGTSGKKRIYNPMLPHGEKVGGKYQNETELSNADGKVFMNTRTNGKPDGLAVMKLTVSRPDEHTVVLAAADQNIRRGGLVYIGGAYVMITDISADGKTLTLSDDVETKFTNGYFAFAQVINSPGVLESEEGANDYDGYNPATANGTDGDGMRECIKSDNSWWAEIPSNNIPDGPITLHITVIDEAGNVAYASLKTSVANNRPRITCLLVGTDWDNNGTFDFAKNGVTNKYANDISVTTISALATPSGTQYGEFVYYSTIESKTDKAGNVIGKSVVTATADNGQIFVVPNKICVIPKFVGGNGVLKYAVEVSENDFLAQKTTDAPLPLKNTESGLALAGLFKYDENNPSPNQLEGLLQTDEVDGAKKYGGVVLDTNVAISDNKTLFDWDDKDYSNNSATPECYINFTFWDETEETTQGKDSLFALVQLPVILKLNDQTKPNATIKPFYWHGRSDNSVHWDEDDNALGHIELEKDLSEKLKEDFGDTTALTKPKVSGQIVVRGTAYDDLRLDSILLKMDGMHSDAVAILTYTDAGWESSADGTKVVSATATNVYADNRGHSVTYEIVLDTAQIATVTGKNKKIEISAKDSSNNVSEVAEYVVDVVPYITKIFTPLAKEDKSNWSIYNRTARGHYPVAVTKAGGGAQEKGDTIYIYGFNLAGGTLSDASGVLELFDEDGNSFPSLESGANSIDGGKQSYPLRLSPNAKGGKITVTVGGIQSINNINNNNASGYKADGITPNVALPLLLSESATYNNLYAYCYNRQPNNSNNNKLTDDIEFDVWDINTQAAKPKSKSKIEQPVMAINQKDKNIGFAFANGSMFFSMGGKYNDKSYSSKYWLGGTDAWTSIGFAYDALGFSYGVTASGDIDGSAGGVDRYRFLTDRWGLAQNNTDGRAGRWNSNRIELIAQLTTEGDVVYPQMERERIQSSSLATTVNGNNTNVYLAYYDLVNEEIRFKWGTFTENHTGEDTQGENLKTNSGRNNAKDVGLFVDEYNWGGEIYPTQTKYDPTVDRIYNNNNGHVSLVDNVAAGETKRTVKGSEYYRLNHVNLIAGRQTKAPVNLGKTANFDTGYNAGEYVSIAALPPGKQGNNTGKDVVAAVWWDATNKQLMYSYIKDPMKEMDKGTKPIVINKLSELKKYISMIDDDTTGEVYLCKGNINDKVKITTDSLGYYYMDGKPLYAYINSNKQVSTDPKLYEYYYVHANSASSGDWILYYMDEADIGDETKYAPRINTSAVNANSTSYLYEGYVLYKSENASLSQSVTVHKVLDSGSTYYLRCYDGGVERPLYVQSGSNYVPAKTNSGANQLYYNVNGDATETSAGSGEYTGTFERLYRTEVTGTAINGTAIDGTTVKSVKNQPEYKSMPVPYQTKTCFTLKLSAMVYVADTDTYKDNYKYKYSGGFKYTADKNAPASNGWETPLAIPGSANIGEYCKLVVDGNGGIHVAAYDSVESKVYYFYKEKYNSGSFTKYVVDSQGSVGEEIGLDVALDSSGKAVPYITYYSKNCARPKIAYMVNQAAGADGEDRYTGDWEIAVVPTSSNVLATNNHYNVGLWKDKDTGKQTYSTLDGTADGAGGTSEIDASDENSCIIYGNGSNNAIVGYAINSDGWGYVETAQKREVVESSSGQGQ